MIQKVQHKITRIGRINVNKKDTNSYFGMKKNKGENEAKKKKIIERM